MITETNKWKPTNHKERFAFLGLTVSMGVINKQGFPQVLRTWGGGCSKFDGTSLSQYMGGARGGGGQNDVEKYL